MKNEELKKELDDLKLQVGSLEHAVGQLANRMADAERTDGELHQDMRSLNESVVRLTGEMEKVIPVFVRMTDKFEAWVNMGAEMMK